MRDSPGAQWFHYSLWEDWHAGLYRNAQPQLEVAERVVGLLCSRSKFRKAMTDVAESWPVASAHNLSNETRNHRPWLGRSAACLSHSATIADTNLAWSMLTPKEQMEANSEADVFCNGWRARHLRGQLRLW